MHFKKRKVCFRKRGYTPRPLVVFTFAIIFILLLIVFNNVGDKEKVTETYTERTIYTEKTVVFEQEYKVETVHTEPSKPKQTSVSSRVVQIKHYPEYVYIMGARMVHGEAGGVKSITERSGCLWIACNRTISDDPFFPDQLEEVIAQECQFYGYDPNGEFTEADYNLAIDVFERFYREQNGETAVAVGRSLPVDYLYFTGDGEHNWFTKTQGGEPYVWGSQLVSPYKS